MTSINPYIPNSIEQHTPTGIYRHYKGGLYRLLTHARVTSVFQENVTAWLRAALSEERSIRVDVGMNWKTGQVEVWVPSVRRNKNQPGHAKYPNGCPVVLYASFEMRQFWVRPLSMWSELVPWPDLGERPRFMYQGPDLTPELLEELHAKQSGGSTSRTP